MSPPPANVSRVRLSQVVEGRVQFLRERDGVWTHVIRDGVLRVQLSPGLPVGSAVHNVFVNLRRDSAVLRVSGAPDIVLYADGRTLVLPRFIHGSSTHP